MKKIDFKKPKYVIPLLALPFVIGLGFLFTNMFGKEQNSILKTKEGFNSEVQDANLTGQHKKSKLEAMTDALAGSSDFSSIRNLEREEGENLLDSDTSLYTEAEKRLIDSISYVTSLYEKNNKSNVNFKESSYSPPSNEFEGNFNETTPTYQSNPAKSKMADEMALFREQMNYLDSLENIKNGGPVKKKVLPKPEVPAVEVKKIADPGTLYFNTVGGSSKNNLIEAILDESLKVVTGSRVRIRLLDDISIDNLNLKKGNYLYGNVTSFTAQRVYISINSILINGVRKKVKLSIFDNDGQEGFYVPASAFRELSKDVGGELSGDQSVTFESETSGVRELAFGAIEDVYKSTSKAISKNVRQNKAKLKYNTQVYLVNNENN